ncbi:phage protein GemA/Gp16 family protein [Roseateles sp. DXS20W]|uniref:Phage protein GemA/Gp16 family protein n=1 Tax=Pelomonas lactea TaxID=3299030 RepID=A0ABW7GKB2_9BURK
MKPAARPAQPRNAALAQIHIAKAQLMKAGLLDDDSYRDMLFAQARVRSAAELDHAGRARVLAHMTRLGAKLGHAGKPFAGKKRPLDRQAQLDKIEALLADAGRSWAYLTKAMVKRICGVDALEFCTTDHLGKLIAALTYDQQRRAKREAAARVLQNELEGATNGND